MHTSDQKAIKKGQSQSKSRFMKKLLFMVAVAAMFTACKNKTNSTDKTMVPLADPGTYINAAGDTARIVSKAPLKDSVTTTTTVTVTKTPVVPNNNHGQTTRPKTRAGNNSESQQAAGASTTSAGGNSNTSASTPQKKKGWSKAAKGTAIGAGAGAVTGAIIGKNVKGAVIGGVVGAAGGYIIGRSQDKKDGRVRKDSL